MNVNMGAHKCQRTNELGRRCALWKGHDKAHDYRVNAPDESMTWTKEYRDGWGEGYRAGIMEGLCRAANAVEVHIDKQREYVNSAH